MRAKERLESILRSVDDISARLSCVVEDTTLSMAVHGLYAAALPLVGDVRASLLLQALISNESERTISDVDDLIRAIDATRKQIDYVSAMRTISRVEKFMSGDIEDESVDVPAELRRAAGLLADRGRCKVDTYRMRGDNARNLPDANAYDESYATGTVFDSWCITGPGDLCVILAPPGVGKTTALVHVGGHTALRDLGTVFHFSLEMSMLSIVKKYINSIRYTDQKINVYYAPPSSMTVQRIQDIVENELSASSGRPACIIVDHISHLSPPAGGTGGMSKYDRMSENVLLLKALAHTFKCPVWTASQPQRGSTRDMRSVPSSGTGGYVLGMQDVAECWAIPQVADTIISINQTDAEREADPVLCRLHAAKVRNPKPNRYRVHTVQSTIDYAHCNYTAEHRLI